MRVTAALCALLLVLAAGIARADADDRLAAADRKFQWKTGDVPLGDGDATLHTTDAFRYLDHAQSQLVLEKIWSNPPGSADSVIGMVFPSDMGPLTPHGWAVVVSYDTDGWISDEGASAVDYDDLLKNMQSAVVAENAERKKRGFIEVELKGWAEPPHYDAGSHKLYWAKQLHFSNSPDDQLNYNIRVLGRSGVLVLNAVAEMSALDAIKPAMEQLVPLVEFNEGHRYADYVPGKDKVAKYGLVALVAGGAAMAAKAGLLKWLIAGLLAAKKFVAVGLVTGAAAVRRFFSRKAPKPPELPPAPSA
jgi:uncharacterized membrane-anchored protein